MYDIQAILKACHNKWPTAEGVRHNITLEGDNPVINMYIDGQWLSVALLERDTTDQRGIDEFIHNVEEVAINIKDRRSNWTPA